MSEHRVKIADYAVAGAGSYMRTVGLGSCVAIILHDAEARIGALAHVLLPRPEDARDASNPAKFPSTVVPVMVAEMRSSGSRGSLVAKLVGGASMFRSLMTSGAFNVGERNVAASREALRLAGIPVLAEEVGGEVGRSVQFCVADGTVVVRTVGGAQRVL